MIIFQFTPQGSDLLHYYCQERLYIYVLDVSDTCTALIFKIRCVFQFYKYLRSAIILKLDIFVILK